MFEEEKLEELLNGLELVRERLLDDMKLVPGTMLDEYEYMIGMVEAAADLVEYNIAILEISEQELQVIEEGIPEDDWRTMWNKLTRGDEPIPS